MPYIEFSDVVRSYGEGGAKINALDGASFVVEKGELAVILGASGAGKTTALNILGGMDSATSGKVVVGGRDISAAGENDLVMYRRADVGFVFQFYNLVPNLTALENVELAAQICPDSLDAAQTLEKVGLAERLDNFPAQLSGGEQQRVSIARAIAKNPKLLLCDEPTGALDYVTGKQILQLLQDTCRRDGITVIIVTHNAALADMADRLIRFKSGRVTDMTVNPDPRPIAEIEVVAGREGRGGTGRHIHCVFQGRPAHGAREPEALRGPRHDHRAWRDHARGPARGMRGPTQLRRRLL